MAQSLFYSYFQVFKKTSLKIDAISYQINKFHIEKIISAFTAMREKLCLKGDKSS